MKEPEEEPSLADRFVAATYEHKKFHGKAAKLATDAYMRYRLDMKQAHRFVLDDSFTDMVTRLSFAAPEKTLARIQYATLPYDQTWIEFSLHIKMKVIHALYGRNAPDLSQVGERMGMLVQRIDDTRAVCTLINQFEDVVLPNSTSYFFSVTPTDFGAALHHGCKPIIMPPDVSPTTTMTREQAMDLTRASLWGYTNQKGGQVVDLEMGKLSTPKFLERHGCTGTSRMNAAYMFQVRGETLAEMMTTEIREFTGTIRWLVTMLAMLNETPISTSKIERTGYMRAGRLGKNKLLDHHKVSLVLPKTNPFKYYERKLSHGEIHRRRAHKVRSHWRTYLHDPHCGFEQHDWVYDHDNGYRLCAKCEAYGTLIPVHVRGDARLGWVTKDYVVTANSKLKEKSHGP